MERRASGVRQLLKIGASLFAALATVVLVPAAWVGSHQTLQPRSIVDVQPPSGLPGQLGALIRYKTISRQGDDAGLEAIFADIRGSLAEWYPLVHASLSMERFDAGTVMYRWEGKDKQLAPVMLYAHLDVVPADEQPWRFAAFSGATDGRYVYGRGALDDKFSVVATLSAIEELLRRHYQPRRTLLVVFGHDEEISGERGAAQVAAALKQRSVALQSILDEGSAVVQGTMPGIRAPVAAVAVAEKGYFDVEMCVVGQGGHSSSPPQSTAIGILSAAIEKLERHPPARTLNPLMRQTLTYATHEMDFLDRLVFANLWLTGPIVVHQLEANPITRALLGTTQAVTMIQGGIKANVLPSKACATVNFRLYPGTSAQDLLAHLRKVIGNQEVRLKPLTAPFPSSIASLSDGAGIVLNDAIRETFPDAVVVPVLSPGTTDSRHFAALAAQIFRFSPIVLADEDLRRIHGADEKISVENLAAAFRFYYSYIVRSTR